MDEHRYKTVTNLPPVPATMGWWIIEAHHTGGTTWWLILVDSLWNQLDRHGWKTGYTPTSDQLIRRARTIMKKHDIRE